VKFGGPHPHLKAHAYLVPHHTFCARVQGLQKKVYQQSKS